jgi:hypothetical protein
MNRFGHGTRTLVALGFCVLSACARAGDGQDVQGIVDDDASGAAPSSGSTAHRCP